MFMSISWVCVAVMMAATWSTIFLQGRVYAASTCSEEIPHGSVTSWCIVNDFGACPYSCDEGYTKNNEITFLTCSSGSWILMTNPFCIPNPCPRDIPNGAISSACEITTDASCDYSCVTNYHRNSSVTSVTCLASGSLDVDVFTLCLAPFNPVECPYRVKNGHLASNCSRRSGDKCSFSCNSGYNSTRLTAVQCNTDGQWDADINTVCQETMCPDNVSNGALASYFNSQPCARRVGEKCKLRCDAGYVQHVEVNWLKCAWSGEWQADRVYTGKLCSHFTERCSRNIPNGYVTWWCDTQAGAECTYSCNNDCKQNSDVSYLHCTEIMGSIEWSEDVNTLCTCERTATTVAYATCPSYIPNGRLNSMCRRRVGETCSYYCDTGYQRLTSAVHITCQARPAWDFNEYDLCGIKSSASGASVTTVIAAMGAVFIIIIIIVCVVIQMKRRSQSASSPPRMTMTTSNDGTQWTHSGQQLPERSRDSPTLPVEPSASLVDAYIPPEYNTVVGADSIHPEAPPPSYEEALAKDYIIH